MADDVLLRLGLRIDKNGRGSSRFREANRLECSRMRMQFQSPGEHGNHAVNHALIATKVCKSKMAICWPP
jgi:hypothetical protein